jgi:hypothetical protein
MTYKIELPLDGYRNWEVFRDTFSMSVMSPTRVSQHISSICPDIISTSYDPNKGIRTFEFESEQHYHWFLLTQ